MLLYRITLPEALAPPQSGFEEWIIPNSRLPKNTQPPFATDIKAPGRALK